ncbi:Hypothetical protein NTJ_06856 [Nesidiocoris tenuis]|uniref:Uncharacterized protein n=1 Tax=Nesidiocoris tenuis TaxID=355587 RepID=A0ABN7APA0_9HEMI|nr:Hypothetical protein NTJ_06856 [Nesidiocoris tenuis]
MQDRNLTALGFWERIVGLLDSTYQLQLIAKIPRSQTTIKKRNRPRQASKSGTTREAVVSNRRKDLASRTSSLMPACEDVRNGPSPVFMVETKRRPYVAHRNQFLNF